MRLIFAVCAALLLAPVDGSVWTARGDSRRVISMRYAHAKEARRWLAGLD